MTRPTEVAEAVVEGRRPRTSGADLLDGEAQVHAGRRCSSRPAFRFHHAEPAVEVFSFLSAFYENQRQLMQTPGVVAAGEPDRKAPLIVESALAQGRHLLNEVESRRCWRLSASRSRRR